MPTHTQRLPICNIRCLCVLLLISTRNIVIYCNDIVVSTEDIQRGEGDIFIFYSQGFWHSNCGWHSECFSRQTDRQTDSSISSFFIWFLSSASLSLTLSIVLLFDLFHSLSVCLFVFVLVWDSPFPSLHDTRFPTDNRRRGHSYNYTRKHTQTNPQTTHKAVFVCRLIKLHAHHSERTERVSASETFLYSKQNTNKQTSTILQLQLVSLCLSLCLCSV